ncbi:response regulator [Lutibacter sp.]|uniref:response regulator n=1 Tax=Lutibacter sp. TaxID=1925666 RepID=UPI001A25DAB4|nr:response regulator [Lutibacter sp.]MBI9041528.1 response regulator [Lutibacter sp.]
MKLKILIIEDDEVSQIFLTEIVESISREILITSRGLKGIEYCKNHSDIDLILMDIKLPDLDGYEATKQIRSTNKNVIIIAQTANAMNADRKKAINAGCNDYVSKPISKGELLKKINQYFPIKILT